jgi:hypothetical protein
MVRRRALMTALACVLVTDRLIAAGAEAHQISASPRCGDRALQPRPRQPAARDA